MTILGYTNSEPWANAMIYILSNRAVNFLGNIDSIEQTNLNIILLDKGWETGN